MKNLFVRHKINKCIAIIESSDNTAGLSDDEIALLYSKKYNRAMHILENSGCITCAYRYGDKRIPYHVSLTHDGFSIYQLNRHDVWINRFWGFISGVSVSIVAYIIKSVLL